MNETVGVDCIIDQDGRVHIQRVQLNDQWVVVEQGRQWQDENGRHVLINIIGGDIQEILLSPDSLQWELVPRWGGAQIA